MTQRDEGHDYRDSKNKAEAYNRKKITKDIVQAAKEARKNIQEKLTNEKV